MIIFVICITWLPYVIICYTYNTIFICRHPIPDYYSISVEIARDRITTASEVVCDSSNSNKMPCPEGYNDGDTYLHRSINEACHKMVSPSSYYHILALWKVRQRENITKKMILYVSKVCKKVKMSFKILQTKAFSYVSNLSKNVIYMKKEH